MDKKTNDRGKQNIDKQATNLGRDNFYGSAASPRYHVLP